MRVLPGGVSASTTPPRDATLTEKLGKTLPFIEKTALSKPTKRGAEKKSRPGRRF